MSILLKDVIDIPERVEASDYVLKLTDSVGSEAVRRTLENYVVTDQLAESFDHALGLVTSAMRTDESKAAFLAGSFGSGKSHFMAVLHALLRQDPVAREKRELAPIIDKHDADLQGKKVLPLAFHLLDSRTMEEALFSGYLRQIKELHPDSSLPALHRNDSLLDDAANLREALGDEKFFAKLNGEDDIWAQTLASYDAASYDAAVAAAPGSETRQNLIQALIDAYFSNVKDSRDYIDLEDGLAIIASHAKGLGYDAVVLFLDELVLWLAFMAQERDRFGREAQKLTKLVESSRGKRAIPLISFVARQMDLRKWFADSGASGQEQEMIEQGFRFQEGRFAQITLGDDNLPYVASQRLLVPKDEAARATLDEAFRRLERTPQVWDVLLDGVNTDDDHRGSSETQFRLTYPFSPALVSTLKSLASVMQRERTALKVMQQMLVDRRETLTIDDVIPVGDCYGYVVQGTNGQAIDEQTARQFKAADTLYLEKLRPELLEANHLDAPALDDPAALPRGYQADDRLAKTLLLSAVAPKVPALKDLTAARLASLNHGSIVTPLPGVEAGMVQAKVRNWAQRIPEVRVEGESLNATIRVQLADVDYESVVDKAKGNDSLEHQQRIVSEAICDALDLDPSRADMAGVLHKDIVWRGTSRPVEVIFGNVRRADWLTDNHFEPAEAGAWRVIIDYPLEEANHSSVEDLERIDRLKEHGLKARTLVWVPHFLAEAKRVDLRRLGVLTWVLANDERWRDHADHLSEADRITARTILLGQKEALQNSLVENLKQTYGITSAVPGTIDQTGQSPRLLSSFDPTFAPEEPHGTGFATSFTNLVREAFDATYPRHPEFSQPDDEIRLADLRQVQNHLVRAMNSPDRRVPIEGDRRAVTRVVKGMGVGSVGETHFLFGDDSFGDWGNIIEKGISSRGKAATEGVTVGLLREILDAANPPRGLLNHYKDLVVIAWGLLRQRAWFRDGRAMDELPLAGSLTPAMELRAQELPDEAVWAVAVRRAKAIFGLNIQPFLTPVAMAKLASEVKEKAIALRPGANSLVTELGRMADQLGVEGTGRQRTALDSHQLVSSLAQLSGLKLVKQFAAYELSPSEQVIGKSLMSAQQVADGLHQASWKRIEPIIQAAENDERAARILGELRDAFGRDEFVIGLLPAWKKADDAAFDWAMSFRGATQRPNPVPDPVQSPTLSDADDVDLNLPVADHAEQSFTAGGGESEKVLAELRRFLTQKTNQSVYVRWGIEE